MGPAKVFAQINGPGSDGGGEDVLGVRAAGNVVEVQARPDYKALEFCCFDAAADGGKSAFCPAAGPLVDRIMNGQHGALLIAGDASWDELVGRQVATEGYLHKVLRRVFSAIDVRCDVVSLQAACVDGAKVIDLVAGSEIVVREPTGSSNVFQGSIPGGKSRILMSCESGVDEVRKCVSNMPQKNACASDGVLTLFSILVKRGQKRGVLLLVDIGYSSQKEHASSLCSLFSQLSHASNQQQQQPPRATLGGKGAEFLVNTMRLSSERCEKHVLFFIPSFAASPEADDGDPTALERALLFCRIATEIKDEGRTAKRALASMLVHGKERAATSPPHPTTAVEINACLEITQKVDNWRNVVLTPTTVGGCQSYTKLISEQFDLRSKNTNLAARLEHVLKDLDLEKRRRVTLESKLKQLQQRAAPVSNDAEGLLHKQVAAEKVRRLEAEAKVVHLQQEHEAETLRLQEEIARLKQAACGDDRLAELERTIHTLEGANKRLGANVTSLEANKKSQQSYVIELERTLDRMETVMATQVKEATAEAEQRVAEKEGIVNNLKESEQLRRKESERELATAVAKTEELEKKLGEAEARAKCLQDNEIEHAMQQGHWVAERGALKLFADKLVLEADQREEANRHDLEELRHEHQTQIENLLTAVGESTKIDQQRHRAAQEALQAQLDAAKLENARLSAIVHRRTMSSSPSGSPSVELQNDNDGGSSGSPQSSDDEASDESDSASPERVDV